MTAAGQLFANNAVALLGADIGPTDNTIKVPAGLGALYPQPTAPHEFFLITLETVDPPLQYEIVKIISRTGDILIVAPDGRGWEGTTARSWTAGATLVDHRITAATLRGFQGPWGQPTTALSIAAGDTAVANALDISGPNKTCKWLVTIQTSDGRICMSEILAVYKATGPKFIQYARVGDKVDYDVNVSAVASNMVLNITNNDSSDLVSVDVIRLQHYT